MNIPPSYGTHTPDRPAMAWWLDAAMGGQGETKPTNKSCSSLKPDVQYAICPLLCPQSSLTDPPENIILYAHHDDITQVDLRLTEPSQVDKLSGEKRVLEASMVMTL